MSTIDSADSASIVIEPAAAATSGPKIRSHSGRGEAAAISLRASAAATGVPNIAPSVPATASPAQAGTGITGSSRAPSATASPTLIAMIGFSGPRLTPPASVIRTATASPGSTEARSGGAVSSVVAGSGPAWPGTNVTTSPAARPTAVSIPIVQAGDVPSMPTCCGSHVHRTSSSCPATTDSTSSAIADPTPTTMPGSTSASSWRADDAAGIATGGVPGGAVAAGRRA